VVEAALFTPVLVLLLMGLVELGRVAYTYVALQKILYSLARYLGTQQGVNFCDETDATVTAAKNFALTGTTEATTDAYVANLSADQIQVRIERRNAETGELEACECSSSGCDPNAGGLAPDAIVVSIPGGYPVQLRIPRLLLDPIPLKPQVRLPYGGT
jgi:Flp pilus assembly protein TadG